MSQQQKEQPGFTEQYLYGDQNNSKSNFLIEQHNIPGTPFLAVRYEETWFLMWGDYKLTNGSETMQECIDTLIREQWNVQAAFTFAITHAKQRMEEQRNKEYTEELEELRAEKKAGMIHGIDRG